MGIGIHTGSAVVGWMGYAETTSLTAVGDTVHVASRLAGLTKE
jgi:adenylate cyclase